jgi:hypothetical protein
MNLDKSVIFGFLVTVGICTLVLVLYLAGIFGDINQTKETLNIQPEGLSTETQTAGSIDDLLATIAKDSMEDKASLKQETAPPVRLEQTPEVVSNFADVDINLDEMLASFGTAEDETEAQSITEYRRFPSPLPREGVEKYYVAKGEQCFVIDYMCDAGWDMFTDEVGCGCEKKITPEVKPVVEVATPDYKVAENPWGPEINPSGQAPENQWQAFYFSTGEPEVIVPGGVTNQIGLNASWDGVAGIEPETFAGYWVGNWNFLEPTVKEITVSQSWAKTRLIINGKIVFEGGSDESVEYLFESGNHLIEIEYLNNRGGVDFSVGMVDPVELLKLTQIKPWLKSQGLESLPLAVASVYEPGGFSDDINLDFTEFDEPVVLLLSSYHNVQWQLSNLPEMVQGVVVASFKSGARVVGAGLTPTIYVGEYLDLPRELAHRCTSTSGYAYCEDKGLVELDQQTQRYFGRLLSYFTGEYSPERLALPGTIVTPALRRTIIADYNNWQADQNTKVQKQNDFDSLFE